MVYYVCMYMFVSTRFLWKFLGPRYTKECRHYYIIRVNLMMCLLHKHKQIDNIFFFYYSTSTKRTVNIIWKNCERISWPGKPRIIQWEKAYFGQPFWFDRIWTAKNGQKIKMDKKYSILFYFLILYNSALS